MQKVQSSWQLLAKRLEGQLRASSLGLKALAEQSQVDYYAIRRMRRDGVRSRTQNAIALCNYFGLVEQPAETMNAQILAAATQGAWDGTPEHGQFLLELMQCASRYKVISR